MEPGQFGRLKKLLQMTRSDSDGEALNAIRLVNKHLDACATSWEQILQGAASASEVEEDPEQTAIAKAFKTIYDAGSANDFINSLKQQFDRTGELSWKQREALLRNANRVEGIE